VLDRLEKDVFPAFLASNTYKAVANADVARLPFTPMRKYRTKADQVTRVTPMVTSVSMDELAPAGSQSSIDMEIRSSKRMLKKLERHARKNQPIMSPDDLRSAVEKKMASASSGSLA
jgi:hypothetical protein